MHELGGKIMAAAWALRPPNAAGTGLASAQKHGDAGPVPDMMSATLPRVTAKER
jgi:hypothetical protein